MTDVKRGRPRSALVDEAIVAATCDLLLEVGYERLSIEGVAARAGVGKPTVYRRWSSKSQLVSTAILQGRLPFSSDPPSDTGDLRADLAAWLRRSAEVFADPIFASLVRGAAAASADDEEAALALYERFTGPARDALIARMSTAMAAGQVRTDADMSAAADALIGVLLYRVLARQLELGPDEIDGLVDLITVGLAAAG